MGSLIDLGIEFLKGVGPQRADSLKKELGIYTVGDLLSHYPYRYDDRSKIHPIQTIQSEQTYIQLQGEILETEVVQSGKRRNITDRIGLVSGY